MSVNNSPATRQARVARLESALTGALRAGDRQADELTHLSKLNAFLWRAFTLLKQGRYDEAAQKLGSELVRVCDQGSAR